MFSGCISETDVMLEIHINKEGCVFWRFSPVTPLIHKRYQLIRRQTLDFRDVFVNRCKAT